MLSMPARGGCDSEQLADFCGLEADGPVAGTAFDRLKNEINLGVGVFTADHAAAAHRA